MTPPPEGERIELTTPEGVPLRFTVATAGDRVYALLIDLAIVFGGVILFVLLLVLSGASFVRMAREETGILVGFFARLVYFTGFELRWQGRTPGKRAARIRVIDGRGGPLGADAVVARNLTREFEVFLPIQALLAPEQLAPGAPGWAQVAACAWMLLFGLMPLFNKHRLRVGDMIAGTLVVVAPRAVLLEELGRAGPAVEFTQGQLDVYGVYELQVLEDVLRRGDPAALETVAERIRIKIKWDPARKDPSDVFLRAFYAALRARLEQRMLLGKRKADKYS